MAALPQPEHTTLRAIERAVEQRAETRFSRRLGASIIGRPCSRELWYSFRWVTIRQHDGRMLRLFARGHREESTFVELLRNAGVTIHDGAENGAQFELTAIGGHFVDKMDGAGVGFVEAPEKWHVLEFKTSNAKTFKLIARDQVEQAKPDHYAQMMVGMRLSGMDRAFYLVVNKDTDHLYAERVRYKAKDADALMDKARMIITSDRPPEKISEEPVQVLRPSRRLPRSPSSAANLSHVHPRHAGARRR